MKGQTRNKRWIPAFSILALIWGCTFLFIALGLESFTATGIALIRLAFGAVTLLIISLLTRTPFLPRWTWKYVFFASVMWTSLPWMLFAFAQQYVTSALAGIINGATPLMTLLAIIAFFPEEHPTRQRVIGLGVGFVGILIVIGFWRIGDTSSLIGIAALVLAISGYGLGFPFVRRYLSGTRDKPAPHPIALSTGMMIGGLAVVAPLALFTGVTWNGLSSVTPLALAGVAALGILGSGIAYVLNFTVVHRSDATTASTVAYLTPVVAITVGVLLLGEKISWNEPLGGLLVVIGAATAQGLLPLRRRYLSTR